MSRSALIPPTTDPTPLFEHFRGSYGSELLTAAIAHFDIFGRLHTTPQTFEDFRTAIGLAQRPANVLVTALRAMGFLTLNTSELLTLTEIAREHLVPDAEFDVGNYVGLAAQAPGVLGMVELLKSNRPLGSDDEGGSAYIYRDGIKSAMEAEDSARHLTMALAGRAKNVAPALAKAVDATGCRHLVDVGGGTGIYSFALLQQNPGLRASIFDRPEVLKIAAEMAVDYGVDDRVTLVPGDMFVDALPADADLILLSNILHDWDIVQCQRLVQRCADALSADGQLLIHDVFLDDDLAGPLPIALYSAALFTLTEGRAYSAAEYRRWLAAAGLTADSIAPTLVHCGVISASK